MWEMILTGFIANRHCPYLNTQLVNSKATGVGGILGNKGGLQLSFRLYDHLFNFINVHLVHGAKRAEKRHDMMSDLIRNLKIHRDELDPDVLSDFSFILGDLNYRLNTTYLDLIPLIDKVLELKVNLDQLHLAMATQGRYPAYVEFPITFKPTYKRSKIDHT